MDMGAASPDTQVLAAAAVLVVAIWVAAMFRAGYIPALAAHAESRTLLLLSGVFHNATFLVVHFRRTDFEGTASGAGRGTDFASMDSAIIATASVVADMVIHGRMAHITIPGGGGTPVRPMTKITSATEPLRTR